MSQNELRTSDKIVFRNFQKKEKEWFGMYGGVASDVGYLGFFKSWFVNKFERQHCNYELQNLQ